MSIAYLPVPGGEANAERDDRLLTEAFLNASRTSVSPIVGVNERLLLSNEHAARSLAPQHHQTVWNSVCGQMREVSCRPIILSLAGQPSTSARSTPVIDGGRVVGAVLTLDPAPQRPLQVVEATPSAEVFPGDSEAATSVRQEYGELLFAESHVLITGEAGTGKSHMARTLLGAGSRVATVDARHSSEDRWLADLRAILEASTGIVLQHLDELHPPVGLPLLNVLESVSSKRVIATARAPIAACHLLDGMFPGRLHLPPLREHVEDIPAIAAELLRVGHGIRNAYRLSADARRTLWAHDWPGNIAELRTVLDQATDLSPSRIIEPYSIRIPRDAGHGDGMRVARFKQDERQRLIDALEKTHHNKLATAEMLGIARSTLYLKLREFGIKSSASA